VDERDEDVIGLTHVCRAWREVFTSRPSLWTNLDITNEDKARVYLERSKSSSLNLTLERSNEMHPDDPFFQFIPQVIGRLGYLFVRGTPENVQNITAHLSHPAPLLEHLEICVDYLPAPRLTSALFDGDLSSLRELYLDTVRTELPWRNMVNLTSFALGNVQPGEISVIQLLDFFENAPYLREVNLPFVTPTPGAQGGRLVLLACLEWMRISGGGPPSVSLDHLLIPVGVELVLRAHSSNSLVGGFLPRSLDNLRNLSNFTTIELFINEWSPCTTFSGPSGRVSVTTAVSRVNETNLVLESLAQLDTSRTERFRIENGDPLFRELSRALLPMKDLRALTSHRCHDPHIFARVLHPSTSSSEAVICPKLEELVLVLRYCGEVFNMEDAIAMAKARASRGRKLKTIKIVYRGHELNPGDVVELRKHVGQVEYGLRLGVIDDDW